jgi:hypothetical protein
MWQHIHHLLNVYYDCCTILCYPPLTEYITRANPTSNAVILGQTDGDKAPLSNILFNRNFFFGGLSFWANGAKTVSSQFVLLLSITSFTFILLLKRPACWRIYKSKTQLNRYRLTCSRIHLQLSPSLETVLEMISN